MYAQVKKRIDCAISALKKGNSIIVLDSSDRENEGDLIFPGQMADIKKINLMLKYASGIVCLAVSPDHAKKLKLQPMVESPENTNRFHTPFTVSIEASNGVTTGVSSHDRAHTIRVASSSKVKSTDISRPGHIFPLIANDHGVFGRQGHTEASVDIVKLAGFNPAAVLCELMNPDGTMMNKEAIDNFAYSHDIPIISVQDIRLYRLVNEIFIIKKVSTTIALKNHGDFHIYVFYDPLSSSEIIVLRKDFKGRPLVRIHSSCITGDLFGSLKCDCQSQLHHALSKISDSGGILIYLNQEGRNIGLVNKLKAYELQNKNGLNTIEANLALGLPVDNRNYDLAVQILKYFDISSCLLLSNNPEKLNALNNANIFAERMASISEVQKLNKEYLKIKKDKLNHMIAGIK